MDTLAKLGIGLAVVYCLTLAAAAVNLLAGALRMLGEIAEILQALRAESRERGRRAAAESSWTESRVN